MPTTMPNAERGLLAMGLSAEHVDFQRELRRFLAKVAPPELIRQLDDSETYPAEIMQSFVQLDLWGLAVPPEHGGVGADFVSRCVAAEEIQRAGSCLAYAFLPTAAFCAPAIARFGTAEQQSTLLPQIAAGRMRIAMGLTEPHAGSDLMSLTTRATWDGGSWLVSGQKVFTTGADTCDYILALVRTDPAKSRSEGLSLLLIARESPGVTVRPMRKLAGQATHTCEVFLDEVRVPGDMLLGEPGEGAEIVLRQLDEDRVLTAAQSLGTAQGAFDLARDFARSREQFGKPIIRHQAIAHMLVDMQLSIDAARLMTQRAALLLDAGLRCSAEAAGAKILASEAATRVASQAMQVLGGSSYIVESGVERFYREAKIQEIFSGTNQILRDVIARGLR